MTTEATIQTIRAQIMSRPGYAFNEARLREVVEVGTVPAGETFRLPSGEMTFTGSEVVLVNKDGKEIARKPVDDAMRARLLSMYAEREACKAATKGFGVPN